MRQVVMASIALLIGLSGCTGGVGVDLSKRVRRGSPDNPAEEVSPAGDPSANAPVSGDDADSAMTETSLPPGAVEVVPGTADSAEGDESLANLVPADQLASSPGDDTADDRIERMRAIGSALVKEMETGTIVLPTIGDGELSWRVRILPALGYQALFDRFKLDEPWNSPNNLKLLPLMPKVFRTGGTDSTRTGFVLPRGEHTPFFGIRLVRTVDVTDGPDETALLCCVEADRAVPWTKGEDFELEKSDNSRGLLVTERNSIPLLLFDGRVVEIRPAMRAERYAAIFSYCGNEPLDLKRLAFDADPADEAEPDSSVPNPFAGAAAGGTTASSTPALDLSSRLTGYTTDRMIAARYDGVVELIHLADLIRSADKRIARPTWIDAIGGARAVPRIGIGTSFNPGRLQGAESATIEQGPESIEKVTIDGLDAAAGDFSKLVCGTLRKACLDGRLGPFQMLTARREEDGALAPTRGKVDGRYLSVGIEYVGNDRLSTLLDGCRRVGIDLLIHFDVELMGTRQGQVSNTTRMNIYDVVSKRPIYEGPAVNNLRLAREADNRTVENPVFRSLVDLQDLIERRIAPTQGRAVTTEEARVRIAALVEGTSAPNWGAACELREYYTAGLLTADEYAAAFLTFTQVEASVFENASPDEKFRLLLAPQDSSIVLTAREASEWTPPPPRNEAITDPID